MTRAQDWQAAGLYDPDAPTAADRLDLLTFLAAQGCSLQEMKRASAKGRLFALAGDRIVAPGEPVYTVEEAAKKLDVEVQTIERYWRAFGLPAPAQGAPAFSDLDMEALATVTMLGQLFGVARATGLARVTGAAMSRVAEAVSSVIRAAAGDVWLLRSGSELVTGRAFAEVAAVVPRWSTLLDALQRRHLEGSRHHFEQVGSGGEAAVRCGVGFADLSGYTSLSGQLELGDLSKLLSVFEDTAAEVVLAGGGRVVKFLGDAVMYVTPTVDALAGVALALAAHPKAAEAGLQLRAGLAFGTVLAQDGDYFGPTVNLAARLVAAAAPGQVLAAPDMAEALGAAGRRAVPVPPVRLHGFEEPVVPVAVC